MAAARAKIQQRIKIFREIARPYASVFTADITES